MGINCAFLIGPNKPIALRYARHVTAINPNMARAGESWALERATGTEREPGARHVTVIKPNMAQASAGNLQDGAKICLPLQSVFSIKFEPTSVI